LFEKKTFVFMYLSCPFVCLNPMSSYNSKV